MSESGTESGAPAAPPSPESATPAEPPYTVGQLRPGPRGGALRYGSLPGGTGGAGRPPSEVRSWLKRVGTKRLPLLLRRWDDLSDDQRLRLVDLAFRYSGLTSAQVAPSDEIRARMSRTMRVFQPFVPPAEYPQVLRSVLAIWEGI